MAIKVGDKLPHFTALDSDGNAFDSKMYDGKSLVIYFYPKDDTPGCTAQACNLRDNYKKLLKKGE